MPHVIDAISGLQASSTALAQLPATDIIDALAVTAKAFADPHSTWGRRARDVLPASTGLSPTMVDWALSTTMRASDAQALMTLRQSLLPTMPQMKAVPASLGVVILAGNIFSASWRALAEPLLQHCPTLAKASSRDGAFPKLIQEALTQISPTLAQGLAVVDYKGGSSDIEAAVFDAAEVVSVYGSDETITNVRQRLPAKARLIAHGHGLGAVFVPNTALLDEQSLHATCDAIALDVAAYDQRGCMSPQGIWVEDGAAYDARMLAATLAARSLPALGDLLPRGPLGVATAAAELQWRGVGAVQGELMKGNDFAVCHEGHAPFRATPGYRNISVWSCRSVEHLADTLAPFGAQLKVIGVAGDKTARRRVAATLRRLAPRICEVGQMQTPPLDYISDGLMPTLSYSRCLEVP
jgi:hypothetical protein